MSVQRANGAGHTSQRELLAESCPPSPLSSVRERERDYLGRDSTVDSTLAVGPPRMGRQGTD